MKKVACAVLILTMVIFLVNPLSSDARGGYGGGGSHWGGGGHGGSDTSGGHWGSGARGGHWGGGHSGSDSRGGDWWPWWPWAVIGGVAVLSPYYYSPYDAPPPVVIQEQPPVYVQPAPSSTERIFVYPRQGQSEELQAKDRYECHSWAVSQTHYDPTQPTSGMSEAQLNQMRADYQRAQGACLDGRGYTMK